MAPADRSWKDRVGAARSPEAFSAPAQGWVGGLFRPPGFTHCPTRDKVLKLAELQFLLWKKK